LVLADPGAGRILWEVNDGETDGSDAADWHVDEAGEVAVEAADFEGLAIAGVAAVAAS
jgi:hypothetical protein